MWCRDRQRIEAFKRLCSTARMKYSSHCHAHGAEKELPPKFFPGQTVFRAGVPRFRFFIALQPSVVREIFASMMVFGASKNVLFLLFNSAPSVRVAAWRMPLAASNAERRKHPLMQVFVFSKAKMAPVNSKRTSLVRILSDVL